MCNYRIFMNKIFFLSIILLFVIKSGFSQCAVGVDTICSNQPDTLFIYEDAQFVNLNWFTDHGATLTTLPGDTMVTVDWSTSSIIDAVDSICLVGTDAMSCMDTICIVKYIKDCSPPPPVCNPGVIIIKKVGEPSLCTLINNDPSHPLAGVDCDAGGIDNITECQNGMDPTDPIDDSGPACSFDFDMTYTFNDAGTCRFYVTLNCDDSACPITSWDYDISAGTVSIIGTSNSTLNAPTMNSFRPSVLGCGNTIRITREDFADNFPAGFGEDITFTLTANSSSCGCSKTASVEIQRLRAMTFDNQGPQRDPTGTTSYIQANGDYVNGSATPMSSWPMPPPPPSWGVGGPTFITSPYVQSGDAVCSPVGWSQMLGAAGLSICELTLEDNTVITLPAGCAVPAPGQILSTTIANALNVCADFLNHPSIQSNGFCSSIGTQYIGNLTDGQHACINWNFMYSTGYAVKTFKICEDATGNVVGEFVFGDASVDFGY